MKKLRCNTPRFLAGLFLVLLVILAVFPGHSSVDKNISTQDDNIKISTIEDTDNGKEKDAREDKSKEKGIVDEKEMQQQTKPVALNEEITTQKPSDPDHATSNKWIEGLPTIYFITPTYRRAEQIAELTRTAQTLLHVNNLFWIVVEDAPKPSPEVEHYLAECGVKNVYLRVEMPKKFLKVKNKPRGVANRNAGIEWVRKNAKEGVVFFGDDDNSYDLRIFEEIRSTKRVSMFPVGLVTKLGVSSPIVRKGKVIGFYDGWISGRKFPVDMAGFAINVQIFLKNPKALMPFKVGYEEDELLKALKISVSDIEPKAENCTKIWVWHTQTVKNKVVPSNKLKASFDDTNLAHLQKLLWRGV